MKLALAALAVLLAPRGAEAGRYCGADEMLAPADGSTLPISPTIAMHVEDAYFEGKRQHRAVPTKLKITLAGKPVPFTTRDVRVADGLIRYIKIRSKVTGELVITSAKKDESGEYETFGRYTVSESWSAPAKPYVVVTRENDTRLSVYRVSGTFARIRSNAPAISFSVKWRKNAKAAWRTLVVPADMSHFNWRETASTTDASEARIGEAMCGMIEMVPTGALVDGIEIKLVAKLPDGANLEIGELVSPLVLPPAPPRVPGADVD